MVVHQDVVGQDKSVTQHQLYVCVWNKQHRKQNYIVSAGLEMSIYLYVLYGKWKYRTIDNF